MANYSKQKEIIYNTLMSTKSHPDAEWIFNKCQEKLPNISLGTVYRNLDVLIKEGKIIKVATVNERDRYDATIVPHLHKICMVCGSVEDIEVDNSIIEKLQEQCDVLQCKSFNLNFYGSCQDCRDKQ